MPVTYGEAVEPSRSRHTLKTEPISRARALLQFVGCPLSGHVLPDDENENHLAAEYLISDVMLPSAMTKLGAMSERKR
jgi:hypothetical protein